MTTGTTTNGITVISPAEGMYLTDGKTVAEGEVYLSRLDHPGNWREVTAEEAEELRRRSEAEGLG